MTVLETWTEPRPVKLTTQDFLTLIEAGAFETYPKTELIDGVVVAMNSQMSTHARVKSRLYRRLAEAVDAYAPDHEAWVEVSVSIPPSDMPEPDIVVTSFQAAARAPVPIGTVALLVEVADTTLAYDLGRKARLYAAAAVPEYWVVDAVGGAIHQHWLPAGDAYSAQRTLELGAVVVSATLAGVAIATEAL